VAILLKAKSDSEATNQFGSTAMTIAQDRAVLGLLHNHKAVIAKCQQENVDIISSKGEVEDLCSPKNESRQQGGFFSTNLSQKKLSGNVTPVLKLSQLEEHREKSNTPKQDQWSSSYLVEDCKLEDLVESSVLITSVNNNQLEKSGGIEKVAWQDSSHSKKKSLPKRGLINVSSMSLGDLVEEGTFMELLSENQSESSWDGY